MKKTVCVVLVLSLFWAGTALAAPSFTSLAQWKVADGGNDHWYALTVAKMGWETAESTAIALGGHLVSINSADENTFVMANLATTLWENYWIGFTDKATAGVWEWTDGSGQWTPGSSTYQNWRNGEPNDGSDGDPNVNTEMYGMIYNANAPWYGQWNDAQDNQLYFGVMEFTANPTPIPGAVWLLGSGLVGLVGLRRRMAS